MIIIQNISKNFGARVLFKNISFNCPQNAKIALIGNNGAGKTTLLNIFCGFEHDYHGEVIKPKTVRLGYLPQTVNPTPKNTILDEALSGAVDLHAVIHEREAILERMAHDHSQVVFDRYEYLEQCFNDLGGYRVEEDVCDILRGLGFKEEQFDQRPNMLSGGWRMRLEFAKMLLNNPNFLILDEPTNHLDLPSIEWFEGFLKKFNGTVLFVSHDKDLLNRLATHVLHLRLGQLTPYKGNFDAFLDSFTLKQEQNTHLAKGIKQKFDHIQRFVDRFRATPTKAKMVQSRLKSLAKLQILEESIEFEDLDGTMQLKINMIKPSGKVAVQTEDLVIGYDKSLLAKPLSLTIMRGQKIAILGANGLGKTTLLTTLLGTKKALGGHVTLGHNAIVGYFAQEHLDGLQENLTIIENVKEAASTMSEAQVRALLGSLGLPRDDVFKQIKVLSGGEKSRAALACMLVKNPNILFLDEPTNHLDLYACENLGNALSEYDGTVIFVSHNRSFIHTVATHVLYLKEHGAIELEEVE